jgi:hypothetical protein
MHEQALQLRLTSSNQFARSNRGDTHTTVSTSAGAGGFVRRCWRHVRPEETRDKPHAAWPRKTCKHPDDRDHSTRANKGIRKDRKE